VKPWPELAQAVGAEHSAGRLERRADPCPEHLSSSSFEGAAQEVAGYLITALEYIHARPWVVYSEERFQNAASLDERYDWSFRETVSGKLQCSLVVSIL
jgi:hypothetical protein